MALGGAQDPRHRGPAPWGASAVLTGLSGSLSLVSLPLNHAPSVLPAIALSMGPILCEGL